MIEQQKLLDVTISELAGSVHGMKDNGYRLVQIGATTVGEGFEVNYSFDKEYHFVNLRIKIPSGDVALPSISAIYWNAFLYENEIQDLFGIKIKNMAVDYKGHFYKTTIKVPFGPVKKQEKSAEDHG
jgi:ech hydrogenase subunit D